MTKNVDGVVAQISRQYKQGARVVSQSDVTETLDAFVYPENTHPAHVGYNSSLTVNLGNYESIKIGVLLTVPCMSGEIDDAYEFARGWVIPRMVAEKEFAEKELKNK